MSRLRESWYIGLLDSLPLLRDPMLLIVLSLISFLPVFFLFLFSGAGAAMPGLVGAVVLTLAFVGLFAAQSVYFNKNWFRFQDMLVASPVSPVSYALGLSLSTLLSSSPAIVIALAILLVNIPIGPVALLGVLGVTVLMWLSMVFIGFAIGATTKNTRRANSLPQILGFVLGFLPPVYYPLAMLEPWPWLQALAMLVPSTHAAQLAKYYFGLVDIPLVQVIIGWIYLLVFAALMAVITVRRAHWVDP